MIHCHRSFQSSVSADLRWCGQKRASWLPMSKISYFLLKWKWWILTLQGCLARSNEHFWSISPDNIGEGSKKCFSKNHFLALSWTEKTYRKTESSKDRKIKNKNYLKDNSISDSEEIQTQNSPTHMNRVERTIIEVWLLVKL